MGATIYLAADHRGFEQKNQLRDFLRSHNLDVVDLGPETYDADDDYPVFARKVAEAVQERDDACGIILCGSAVGVTIQANRFPKIRAVAAYTKDHARLAREHNNVNVLCLSADLNSFETNRDIMMIFLTAPFSNEPRHRRRVDMLGESVVASSGVDAESSTASRPAPASEPTLSIDPSILFAETETVNGN